MRDGEIAKFCGGEASNAANGLGRSRARRRGRGTQSVRWRTPVGLGKRLLSSEKVVSARQPALGV